MTVSTDIKSVRYEGNGVTDTFAFNGRIFTTSDLAVDILIRSTDVVVETLSPSDYTVSIVSDESAEIVIDAGKIPSASQDILIYRSIDREQNLRLPTGTVFPAKDVEDALDKITILVQDVASDVDRVLKFPLNISGIIEAELPAPENDKILAWDGAAGSIKNVNIASLSTSLDTIFTSLTSGDYLKYDGTNWVNTTSLLTSNNTFSGTNSFTGNVTIGDSGSDTLTVASGFVFGNGGQFNGGVAFFHPTHNINGGSIAIAGSSTSPAYITMAEDTDNGTNKVTLTAPSSIASDYTVTLPALAGTLVIGTDWASYTPAITHDSGAITNATAAGYYRRVGKNLEVTASVTLSGAGGTFGGLYLSIPSGLTIDTAVLTNISNVLRVGDAIIDDSSPSAYYQAIAYYKDTTHIGVLVEVASTSYTTLAAISGTTPITYASGDIINVRFSVPIVGW